MPLDANAAIEISAFPWGPSFALRRPGLVKTIEQRLRRLSGWLGDKDYLESRVTAADLIMTTVLPNVRQTDIVAGYPNLAAYQKRCEKRPAFQRALAAQMAPFAQFEPVQS